MERKVIWIIGMAYSGSSLLNVLLDTQPTIRGIGEGAQVYSNQLAGGPCAKCKGSVAECSLYGEWKGEPFYRYTFDHYECNVIVDSSKGLHLLSRKIFEPEYDYSVVVISKTPHAEAYSLMQHQKWDKWDTTSPHTSVRSAFDSYIAWHTIMLNTLWGIGFRKDIIHVKYHDLAKGRLQTISKLCGDIEEPYEEKRLIDNCFDTTTHIIGGNPSIIHQISGEDFACPTKASVYLDGKYDGKLGKVFVDEVWRTDTEFVEECKSEYSQMKSHFSELLERLGYGTTDDMIDDLK